MTQECVKYCNNKKIQNKSCILSYQNFSLKEDEAGNIYDNLLENVEDEFTSDGYDTTNIDNGEDDIIELDKIKITLTTTENQKNEGKNINSTTIDLKDCDKRLKDAYHIPYEEVLYIKKVDVFQEGMQIPKIEYEVYTKYNRSNLLKLNLSYCDNVKIDISIPIKLTGNIDKYNLSSKYYNDICYTATSDSGTDIIIKDRKEEFINNNKTVCQEKCIFTEYNYTTQRAKCSCDIAESSSSFSKMKIDMSALIKNFIDIKNIANINLLACYNIFLSIKKILNNYGSFFLIVIIFLHFIIIIIFYSKNLAKKIQFQIKDIAFGIKNAYLLQIENIKKGYPKKIKTKKDKQKKNSKRQKEKLKNKNDVNQFSEFTLKKHENIVKMNASNKNENIINIINSMSVLNSNIKVNKKSNMKQNNIVNNRLNTTSNFSELLNKIRKIMKYNDEELNNLNYNLALKIDKRNYCQYYCSLLKSKHDILSTFCNNNDYNSKMIKINLFIFNLSFQFTTNALFFNDDTMHKIYEDKGTFDLEYQIPLTIYSSIISYAFNYILTMLALSQDEILDFKGSLRTSDLNKRIICLNMKIKIKLILYFIFSSICLLFFWYYISIFCAVYTNTQIHLIKDSLISLVISSMVPFILYLLPGTCRIPSLSNIKNNRKYLYLISKALQII